jgi:hypothetical protein
MVLPTLLCRYETFVSHSKRRGLRVFGSRMLREVFGPKTEEVTEDGKFSDEEFNFCSAPKIVRSLVAQ